MTAPELSDPKWDILKLQSIRENVVEVLKFEISAGTIKEAYVEVVTKLRNRGDAIDWACGNCNAAIDNVVNKCWACGAGIDEEVAEPAMALEELRRRARSLKVSDEGTIEEIEARVEEAEQARVKQRKHRRGDVGGIEADGLNKRIQAAMGEGWTKKRVRQYTSYWDPSGVKRILLFHRGLTVHFAVKDGELDDVENLLFMDDKERKRRHFGRDNYRYEGEVAKEVLEICLKVLGMYTPLTLTKESE